MKNEKRAQDSTTERICAVRSRDLNPQGRLSGGCLLQWMDELAGIVSRRHAGKGVATVAVECVDFKTGVHSNDMLALAGKLTFVGRTSMEVRVDAHIEDSLGKRTRVSTAYFVMVAVDEKGLPAEVGGLQIESEAERREWLCAQKRKRLRMQRQTEGF